MPAPAPSGWGIPETPQGPAPAPQNWGIPEEPLAAKAAETNASIEALRTPPSFFPEGRDAAIQAILEGRADTDTLAKNTISEAQRTGKPLPYKEREVPGVKPGLGMSSYDVTSSLNPKKVAETPDMLMSDLYQEAQKRLAPEAAQQPGEGFLSRLGGSFKTGGEGLVNYLRAKYPGAAILPGKDGSIIIKEQGKPARYYDKPALQSLNPPEVAGDIADLGGLAIQTIPGAVAGALTGGTGTIPAMMAGDAAGSAIQQSIGAALPGEENLSAGERLGYGAVNVGAGLVGAGVGSLLKSGVRAAEQLPMKIAAGQSVRQPGSTAVRSGIDVAREIYPIAKEAGVNLTAGEATASPLLQSTEGTLAKIPIVRGPIVEAKLARAREFKGALDKVLDVAGPELPAGEATKKVAALYKGTLNSLREAMIAEATPFMDRVEASGVELPLVASRDTATSLAASFQDRGVLGQKIAAELEDVAENPDRTGRAFQDLLERYGKGTKGLGDAFPGTPVSIKRKLSAAMFSALNKDLDRLSTEAPESFKAVSGDLKAFRVAWKAGNDKIRAVEDDLLTRALKIEGKKPEVFAGELWSKKLGDDQVRRALKLANSMDPEVGAGLRRAALEQGARKSLPEGAEGMLSPQKFSSWAHKNEQRITALFEGDPNALGRWNRFVRLSDHLSRKPEEGLRSWLLWTAGISGGASSLLAAGPVGAGLGAATSIFTLRRLAGILADSEKSQLLMGLISPRPGFKTEALSKIVAQLTADDDTAFGETP